MYVLLAGLNHRTAPVEVREKLAISGPELEKAYQNLADNEKISGAVILATCNRTEIYATTRNIEKGQKVLLGFLQDYSKINASELYQYLYQPNCYEAIMHLFRVASGLDSMILGETEILGQVKEAYQSAIDTKASDSVLNTLFQKAIYVGKKVRNQTEIDKHPISVSHAAVQLAERALGNLQEKTVMIVGAGEMGEAAAKCLVANGVSSVIVSNRSYDKALLMAENLKGRAVRFDRLADEMDRADIVISCTGASHYVIREDNAGKVLKARNGKEILLIDIAVPRDIDPILQEIAGVKVCDIDDLQEVVDANFEQRLKASYKAEEIIRTEIEFFNEWMASLCVVPVITALKAQGELIKNNELRKAFNRLGAVTEHEEKVINSMAHSIVNQLLHSPIIKLKQMAASNDGHSYAEFARKLFSLEVILEELNDNENYKTGNQGQ
ncbi:MAG: glutamyl-tRNA reductase [Syntrophomonadaceae bacterium]|jgi:glutamyl-tRNA reductase|nr:glutamyl-tRNA reductase [Syntrophomonadaceae bacterium]